MPRTDNSLALAPVLDFDFVPRTDNSLALAPVLDFDFVPRTDNSLALAVRAGHEVDLSSRR
ncbi:hypothetical protein [Knoellia pratensis]|uniref:hypothetical protein n=1 Tax=Knoellia pratensis TaxID=3404796 RepID=UPI00360DF972